MVYERTLERRNLVHRLGRVVAQEFRQLAAVLSILVDTKLEVLRKGLIELIEVILVLRNLAEDVHALLNDVFADDLQNLILLESLTRDVQRQVLRINDTLDEVEVLGNEVFTIVHNKDAADIELDIFALFLRLKKIERGTRENVVRRLSNGQKRIPTNRFGT